MRRLTRLRLGLALVLATAACAMALLGACTPFNEYAGGAAHDASPDSSADAASTTTAPDASRDANANDAGTDSEDSGASTTCDGGWASFGQPGAGTCGDRRFDTVVSGLGAVSFVRATRAFAGAIAVLYDQSVDGSDTLSLALIDPTTGAVTASTEVATGPFDDAAMAYDDVDTLGVAYHAGSGAPVSYVTVSPSLVLSAPEEVAASVVTARLALAPIVQPLDGGFEDAGLGSVSGTMGLAWYEAPPTLGDAKDATLHLFARSAAGWSEVETYGYASILDGIELHATAEGDAIAASLAASSQTSEPEEACTWHMAGHSTACVFPSTMYGASLVLAPNGAHLVYAFDAPGTSATTLNVATDTDGTDTFALLSTVTTFADALAGAPAVPRAQALVAGSAAPPLAIVVAYPGTDFAFRIAYVTWDASALTGTVEHVTTLPGTSATTPPFDLVVDATGAADIVLFDSMSGALELARALPSAGGDP